MPNPTGLHARPSATFVGLAEKFRSDIRLRRGDDSANGKSIVSIMSMAVGHAEKVTITAHGPDADEAVEQLADAMRGGLGEDCPPVRGTEDTGAIPAIKEPVAAAKPTAPKSGNPNLLLGVAASPGLGIGTVVQLRHNDIQVTEFADDRHTERRKLNSAIDRALLNLSALRRRLEEDSSADKAAIFAAHQELLSDPDLLDLAASGIDKGKSAPYAWRAAFNSFADQLAGLSNEILAGRAGDVRDVGQRVLEELTAQLDLSKVVGFATTSGGASSHVAIIARFLDIPAVAGIESRALDIAEGARVILDGTHGSLQLNATDADIEHILTRQRVIAECKATEEAAKDEPAVTTDGHRVKVVANIGGVEDAKKGMTRGAEGVGLLRSEFVFMYRSTAPSEAEQAKIYADCARALAPGQPLVIRTLDVGGDKPLSYLPIPAEENPFLGIRGVRVGLEKPEVLRTQLRAILAAADAGAELYVMFPTIATIDDWRRAKASYDEERAASGVTASVSVGVGTNDLTCYTLAMDRGHPKLAAQVDPCNPAVLTLIGNAAEALHAQGKWLGICGGVASDPQAVPILVGLGVDELSCSIPAIPSVKATLRAFDLATCKELAAKAVTCSTPQEVRALAPMGEN